MVPNVELEGRPKRGKGLPDDGVAVSVPGFCMWQNMILLNRVVRALYLWWPVCAVLYNNCTEFLCPICNKYLQLSAATKNQYA